MKNEKKNLIGTKVKADEKDITIDGLQKLHI